MISLDQLKNIPELKGIVYDVATHPNDKVRYQSFNEGIESFVEDGTFETHVINGQDCGQPGGLLVWKKRAAGHPFVLVAGYIAYQTTKKDDKGESIATCIRIPYSKRKEIADYLSSHGYEGPVLFEPFEAKLSSGILCSDNRATREMPRTYDVEAIVTETLKATRDMTPSDFDKIFKGEQ